MNIFVCETGRKSILNQQLPAQGRQLKEAAFWLTLPLRSAAFLIPVLFCLLFPLSGSAQRTVTLTQTVGNATLGPDRKGFGGPYSEGYAHDFDLGASLNACERIVSIDLDISIQSYTPNITNGCSAGQVYYNIYYGCGPYNNVGGSCLTTNNIDEPNFSPASRTPYSTTYNNNAARNFDFGGNFSVDIVPVFNTNCPNGTEAITFGYVAYTYTITVRINIDNTSVPNASASRSDVCPNDGPIELMGSTTTTGTVIDYNWTGPNGFTANGASVFTNDPADEGTYTLITTVDGCDSDPVDVLVEYLPFAPSVSAVANSVCFGDNIELEVTGGGTTFAWLDPAGNPVGNNATLTTPAGGTPGTQTYSVTVSDANCTETLTIPIVVSAEIMGEVILDPMGGVCAGEQIEFTAQMTNGNPFPAGWTFDWNNGGGSGPTYSFTENNPGDYMMEVEVTNPAGCSTTLSEPFSVSASGGAPGQIILPPAGGVCLGEPIIFTARRADGSAYPSDWTFDWNNGAGSGPTYGLTENTPGDYSIEVTATNPAGCGSTFFEVFSIFERPSVFINPGDVTICSDGSAVLTANASGGAGGYQYLWNSDITETGQTLVVDANSPTTQDIFVDITDANGCMAFSTTVDVNILPDVPAVTFGTCSTGSETEITFSWNDVGQTGFELYLTIGAGAEQTISTNYTNLSYTATGLTPGTSATLRVVPFTASNGIVCRGPEQSQTCTTDNVACDNPGWLFTPINPICLTTDGQAFDLTINTVATGTVVLNSTDLALTNQPNGPGGITTVSLPALPGTTSSAIYTVTARFTLTNGSCPFDTTFNIPVVTPADPEISTPLSSICSAQETVQFSLVNAYDPNSTYTITVDNPSGSFIVLEDAPNGIFDISFSEFRTYQVTVTATTTGNTGCSESFTLPFTLTQPPVSPVLSCAGTGLDSVAFSWSDVGGVYTVDQIMIPGTGIPEQTATGFIVRGLTTGDAVTIAVTATAAGCDPVTSDTLTCVAQSCPVITPLITTPVDTFCSDGSEMLVDLTVNVPGAGTLTWSGPGVPVNGNQFDPAAAGAGAHEITVVYTEGTCTYPAFFQLVVVDPPSGTMDIAADSICQAETTTVNFTGTNLDDAVFEWIFPATSTVVSGDINGPGPLDLSFSGQGLQFAQLLITGPFCTLDTLRDSVFVAAPIAAVSLDCNNVGLDQVGFSWTHPTATDFAVTIVSQPAGATISQTNNTLLATGLAEGESVTIEVIALSDNSCPDSPPARLTCTALNCPNIPFVIDPVGPFCVGDDVDIQLTTSPTGPGTLTFADSTFSIGGNFNSAGLTPGVYTVSAVYEEAGCSFPASIDIEITDLPDPSFTLAPSPVCLGEVVGADAGAEMVGWIYEWTLNDAAATVVATTNPANIFISWPTAGTKEVTLIVRDENGCENQSTEIIEVQTQPAAPVISCGNTSYTSMEFNWSTEAGVDSFLVIVNGAPPFFQDSTNLILDGLNDGETDTIFVMAISSGACGNSPGSFGSCTTDSCPVISVMPPTNQTFCLSATGNTVPLVATQTGAGGSGQFTFNGPGVTENSGAYSFDANAAGPGIHTITVVYDESVCSGMASFEFTVNATPTSNFTLNGLASDLTVCEGEVFAFAYSGNLPEAENGTFRPEFAPASRGTDLGYESYELSYAVAGNYVISLSASSNGCKSDTTLLNVTVEAPLSAPVITCGTSSFTSVAFNWSTEAGVDSFQVTVNGRPSFLQDSTNLLVSGLNEGEIVNIQVIAFGSGPCGNSPVGMGSCQSESCPVITVTPPADQTFCLGAAGNDVPLTAIQTGAGGTGQFTFSGSGVTENGGVFSFSPATAGPGTHTITVTYNESVCSGVATFEFTVNPSPTSDFTLNGLASDLAVCEGELFALTYSGNLPEASDGAFEWNFAPASIAADIGYESYELSYAVAGNYVITLLVTSSGCESEVTRLNVTVEAQLPAPVVSCIDFSENSVTFGWTPVAGAIGYQLTDGTTLPANSFNYTVSGLLPGESATLSLVALSASACGNSMPSTEANCTTSEPCDISLGPDRTISIGDSLRLGIITNATIDSIIWQNDEGLSCLNCSDPVAKPIRTTTYYVTIIDVNGCESSDNITITVDERRNIYIPNVFSPNGDGINDYFEIQGGPDLTIIRSLNIYDRWGASLFTAVDQPVNSPDARWLGDMQGQQVSEGVYIYVALVEFTDGHVEKVSGEVLVLR